MCRGSPCVYSWDAASFKPNEYGALREHEYLREALMNAEKARELNPTRAQRERRFVASWAKLCGDIDESAAAALYTAHASSTAASWTIPRGALADTPAHFDRLFDLLGSGDPTIVADAWALLEAAPMPRAVKEDVVNMRGRVGRAHGASTDAKIPWADILDGSSPLRLLYSLRTANEALESSVVAYAERSAATGSAVDPQLPSTAPKNVAAAAGSQKNYSLPFAPKANAELALLSAWGSAFHTSGGVSHILSLYFSIPLESLFAPSNTASAHRRQAAALLVSFVARFLVGPSFSLTRVNGESLVRARLVERTLDWLSFASTRELPRVGEKLALAVASNDSNTPVPPEVRLVEALGDILVAALLGFDAEPSANTAWVDGAVASGRGAAALQTTSSSRITVHALAVSALYAIPRAAETLVSALVVPSDSRVRKAANATVETLYVLANETRSCADSSTVPSTPLSEWLLAAVLKCVRFAYAFPPSNSQEVNAVLKFAVELLSKSHDRAFIDERALLHDLVFLIRGHPILEVGEGLADPTDATLTALLKLATHVISGSQSPLREELREEAGRPVSDGGLGLIDELFEVVLFALGDDRTAGETLTVLGGSLPKAKQKETRSAGFGLLAELATGSAANLADTFSRLLKMQETSASARSTASALTLVSPTPLSKGASRYRMAHDPRNSTGYTGLYNPACLCYLLSMLQQLFMNPSFRKGILSVKVEDLAAEIAAQLGDGATEASVDAAIHDTVAFQLQRLFALMQESSRMYVEPLSIAYALKDYAGEPTDLAEQKDVPETITKIFTDLETQLQGTAQDRLHSDVYGVVTTSQLQAVDPRPNGVGRFFSSSDTPCDAINVRVKNNATLEAALSELTAGETVEYTWELPKVADDGEGGGGGGGGATEGPKTLPIPNTQKRVLIKSTADSLMLHLNRFDFDYDLMAQVKVHDAFEFPTTLDLWPFSVWGHESEAAAVDDANAPPREAFKYELAGVVIHQGMSAQQGHYYNFIRERGADGPSSSDRWFRFDDETVSPWDGTPERISDDCFGGVRTNRYTNYAAAREEQKISSAFCLFYERAAPARAAARGVAAPAQVAAPASAALVSAARAHVSFDVRGDAATAVVQPPADVFGALAAVFRGPLGVRTDSVRMSVRAKVPAHLADRIRAENANFWLSHWVGSETFAEALVKLSSAATSAVTEVRVRAALKRIDSYADARQEGGATFAAAWTAVSFLRSLCADSSSISLTEASLSSLLSSVSQLFGAAPTAAQWFVVSSLRSANDFAQLLFQRPLGYFRESVELGRSIACDSFSAALTVLGRLADEGDVVAAEVVSGAISWLLSSLSDARSVAAQTSKLFELISNVLDGSFGVRAVQLALRARALARLVDFALCDAPTLAAYSTQQRLKGSSASDYAACARSLPAPDSAVAIAAEPALLVSKALFHAICQHTDLGVPFGDDADLFMLPRLYSFFALSLSREMFPFSSKQVFTLMDACQTLFSPLIDRCLSTFPDALGCLVRAVEVNLTRADFIAIPRWYRLAGLAIASPHASEAATALLLPVLLRTAEAGAEWYSETETALESLAALARRHPDRVVNFFGRARENGESPLAWAVDWLRVNPNAKSSRLQIQRTISAVSKATILGGTSTRLRVQKYQTAAGDVDPLLLQITTLSYGAVPPPRLIDGDAVSLKGRIVYSRFMDGSFKPGTLMADTVNVLGHPSFELKIPVSYHHVKNAPQYSDETFMHYSQPTSSSVFPYFFALTPDEQSLADQVSAELGLAVVASHAASSAPTTRRHSPRNIRQPEYQRIPPANDEDDDESDDGDDIDDDNSSDDAVNNYSD